MVALALGVVGWAAWLRGLPARETAPAGETRSADAEPAAGTDAAASFGDGFVVWESNRSGAWRLWRRELASGEARMLSPDEDPLVHCCAHISPDGSRIAYLRYRAGQRRGSERPPVAELWLMAADGGDHRPLDGSARLPSESRSVVWLGEGELLYVGDDGHTRRLDLDSGRTVVLTRRPHERDGWLIDRTLAHATTGWVTFSPYDRETATIAERQVLGGCQPYFSHDGRWGFWIAGAGGPINRIDLASREISTVLAKNDERLLPERGYLYFPMLSRDGGLLAFGASANEHDFTKADYDVFVVATDPATLEVESAPLRITEHPATDRFPDVFRSPLPLGRHRGEAPLTVSLRAPSSGHWTWELADGSPPTEGAETIEHRFAAPGVYQVRARRNGEEVHGLVVVRPAQPPQVVDVRLLGGQTLEVVFDEEVELGRVEVALDGGGETLRTRAADDRRTLVVELAAPLERVATLHLARVVDRAQRPNEMPAAELELRPAAWPSDPSGLVLLWQTADAPNLVRDPGLGAERTHVLEPRGRTRLDHHHRMRTDGGAFVARDESAERIAALVRETNRLTIELRLASRSAGESGRRDVVTFGGVPTERQNFVLSEEGSALVFRLRDERLELFELERGRAAQIAVTYSPGQLRAYRDGELVLESDALQGDFFHWRRRPLVFGSGPWGGNDWAGTLEGIAIYRRILSPEEIRESARRYARLVRERPAVASQSVRAKLLRRSAAPTLEEIAPYRQALVVHEYESEQNGRRWRVAHWAVLDGELLPITDLQPEARVELELERFADNPQLDSLLLRDTLPPAPGLELHYDTAHP